MQKSFTLKSLALAALCMAATGVQAQDGQPHSLTGEAQFSTVSLSWKAPKENIELAWHDGSSYNGVDGKQNDPQGAAVLYAGAKFTADDLRFHAGQKVDSIFYFEYRNVGNVRVQIYEDGSPVRDQKVDVSGFTKNSWRKVALDEPYTLPTGKDIIFAVRFEHGYNQNFVANTDVAPTTGKGNIYSYDGKTWKSDAPGDFLITAVLHNDAKEDVTGYYITDNGKPVNTDPATETTYTIESAEDGSHKYGVTALYADGTEKPSTEYLTLQTLAADKMLPPAASFTGTASELGGSLKWQAPLQVSGNVLTWSDQAYKNAIGGTASSPKVWIKQEFDANDLLAAQGAKITAINSYLAGAVTGVTAFVMKNGVIDRYEAQPDSVVKAINASGWNKFTLAEPYTLETGNTYAFGLYYTHAKGLKPIGTDSAEAIDEKGNSFSTSSPNSKNFANSKPSWKTLSSGDIAGNFLLTADIEGDGSATLPTGYEVRRNDGKLVASGNAASTFEATDEVDGPGTYTYTLSTTYEGKKAPELTTSLTYTMPAAYAAPTILAGTVDDDNKFSLQWSSDAVELKHYGTASYMAGFDEDIALLYGAKFAAEELADYAGYEIRSLKFGLGAELDSFKVEIINGKGERLYTQQFEKGDLQAGALYNMSLDKPVTISGTDDIYLAYNATLPGGKSPMILDAGPLVDGGAMISYTDGKSWMKLGTIASSYNDYNIVIAATAIAPANASRAKAHEVELTRGNSILLGGGHKPAISAEAVREAAGNGIGIAAETAGEAPKAVKKAKAAKPKAKSFKVYCNGEVAEETVATEYNATIGNYGVFNYHVTTIFENGWESPASRTVTITNDAPQKGAAPYDLQGSLDDATLKLTWKVASEGTLSYENDDNENMAIGMTGSGTREAYTGIRFTTDTLANFAGQKLTHISFGLNSTDLKTAAVFVMEGNDIVYEQEVNVSDLNVGRNVVRLNTPYAISDGRELTIGYHTTYANGVKPHLMDKGPANHPGYSDLISSSASDGYWYSLKTRYKQDYNLRISGIMAKADNEVPTPSKAPRKEAAAQTYNVYLDGTLLASGVTALAYDVENAANGSYTVTAVAEDGKETIASNAVVLNAATGISTVEAKANAAESAYSLNGTRASQAAHGIFIMKTADGKVKKVVK